MTHHHNTFVVAGLVLALSSQDAAAAPRTEMMGVTAPAGSSYLLRATGNPTTYAIDPTYDIPSLGFSPSGAAIADDGEALQVVAWVGQAIRHARRFGDEPGSWTQWGDVVAAVGQSVGEGVSKAVMCMGSDGMHLFAMTPSTVKHAIRYPSGQWQQGWTNVRVQFGNYVGPITDVACAPTSTGMFVAMVFHDDIAHTTRTTSTGQWSLLRYLGTRPSYYDKYTKVAAMRLGSEVHVMASTQNGSSRRLWHTKKYGIGPFDPWGDVLAATGWTHPSSNVTQISAAPSSAGADFVVLLENGTPFLTRRKFDAYWDSFLDLRLHLNTPQFIGFNLARYD